MGQEDFSMRQQGGAGTTTSPPSSERRALHGKNREGLVIFLATLVGLLHERDEF